MKLDDLMALVDRHVMSDVTSDLHSESRRERVESQYVQWLEAKCDELERAISAYSTQATQSENHGKRMAVMEARVDTMAETLKARNPDQRLEEFSRRYTEALDELRSRPATVDDAPLRAVADRVAALERAPAPVVESPITEPMPSEYDIDVVRSADDRVRALNISALGLSFDVLRGGDNRIRTLRVRVAE
jgi:hypothetical protein